MNDMITEQNYKSLQDENVFLHEIINSQKLKLKNLKKMVETSITHIDNYSLGLNTYMETMSFVKYMLETMREEYLNDN